MAELSTIKIHPKVYVGIQGREYEDDVPLGFMTPWDETAAFQKRKATVDSWVENGGGKAMNSTVMENTPMIGFKVGRAIRRHSRFSGTSTAVRVEDPRGFELEISIENMVMIMDHNIIEDGELLQECVWGRDGAKNVLLPINSDPYKEYLDTVERVANKVSLRDVKIGDHIEVLGGRKGIYLGTGYEIRKDHEHIGEQLDGSSYRQWARISDKKRYLVYHPAVAGKIPSHPDLDEHPEVVECIKSYTKLSVGVLIQKAAKPMTPAEVDAFIGEKISGGVEVDGIDYQTFAFTVSDKGNKIEFIREEIPATSFSAAMQDYNLVFAISADGHCVQADRWNNLDYNYVPKIGTMREYETGAYHKAIGSYWETRTKAKTDGYIGSLITKIDDTGIYNSQLLGHVNAAKTDHLFTVKYQVTTSNGVVYTNRF